MGKRRRTVRLERRPIDSAVHEFRVNYGETKHFGNGKAICSDTFSAGGYIWRVQCFPDGFREEDKGSVSLMFELVSKASVSAIFEAFITVEDGQPWAPCEGDRTDVQLLRRVGDGFHLGGWGSFVSQDLLEKYYLIEGHVTFICAIMVVGDSSVPVLALETEEHFVSKQPHKTWEVQSTDSGLHIVKVDYDQTNHLEMRTIDSAFHEFKVDYEQTKHVAIGEAIRSDTFSIGRCMWRVHYYPHGISELNKSYVSIFIELVRKSIGVKGICEAFILGKDGQPFSYSAIRESGRRLQFQGDKCGCGWPQFVLRSDLEKYYLTEGHIRLICAIMVVHDKSTLMLPSDIKKNSGKQLGSTVSADVSFTIGGEMFHAHRAVLAARSPIFREELLGFMDKATKSSCITLYDIAPAIFRAILQFIYTDTLPGDDELGDSPFAMMQQLLAAADRYALDGLKLMCAQKLGDNVSVDTVPALLGCAESYSCPELKNKCIDFLVMEENFKKAVLTKGFMQLGQIFPSIIDELRERIQL